MLSLVPFLYPLSVTFEIICVKHGSKLLSFNKWRNVDSAAFKGADICPLENRHLKYRTEPTPLFIVATVTAGSWSYQVKQLEVFLSTFGPVAMRT